MKLILQRIYFFFWGVPVFVVCMVVYTLCILLSLFLIPNKRRAGRVAYFWLRCWGLTFSTCVGIFYKTSISEALKKGQTYVFACNHNSFIDGICICLSVPGDFRPLGKVELMKIPVFGWMYRYVVILVDRNSVESRQKSMVEMQKHLNDGISVLVFPEGTMNQTESILQPFKNGAFVLAVEMQTSIVPMVMYGTKQCMPRRPKFTLQPGIVKTYFLDPVETRGMDKKDIDSLKSKVFLKMQEKLVELEGLG